MEPEREIFTRNNHYYILAKKITIILRRKILEYNNETYPILLCHCSGQSLIYNFATCGQ